MEAGCVVRAPQHVVFTRDHMLRAHNRDTRDEAVFETNADYDVVEWDGHLYIAFLSDGALTVQSLASDALHRISPPTRSGGGVVLWAPSAYTDEPICFVSTASAVYVARRHNGFCVSALHNHKRGIPRMSVGMYRKKLAVALLFDDGYIVISATGEWLAMGSDTVKGAPLAVGIDYEDVARAYIVEKEIVIRRDHIPDKSFSAMGCRVRGRYVVTEAGVIDVARVEYVDRTANVRAVSDLGGGDLCVATASEVVVHARPAMLQWVFTAIGLVLLIGFLNISG